MFVRAHIVSVLRRFHPVAYTYMKYQATNPSRCCSSTITCSAFNTSSRSLSTGMTLTKDASQHKPELDLDGWKSVMRSQTLQDEKPKDREEETTAVEEGGGEEGDSPVEMSRALVDMWRQAGKKVPDEISDKDLETFAKLPSKSSKKKYLKYLAIKEGYRKADKEKKDKRRAERLEELTKDEARGSDGLEDAEEGHKFRNAYLLQFWTRSLDRMLGWKGVQAMQFGQPLVFDMSYDQYMMRREIENTVSQLMESEGWNRRSLDPFHLHFCNLQPESACQHELIKRYGQEPWNRLFITATSKRHVDTFPREDLVYLTADSPNVLHTFDHSKVYIVGAMVDRSIQTGLSLANAKRLKITTARLPLDEYLYWETGAKNLTLDQIIRILLTVKETGDWEKALGFVPKRKHDGFHHQRREDGGQRTERSGKPVATFRGNAGTKRGKTFASKPSQNNLNRSDVTSKPTFGSINISGQSRLRTALKSKLAEPSKMGTKRN